MDGLFDQCLINLEAYLHVLEKLVPPPQRTPFKDSFVFRYSEQTICQALLQKLVRIVSGLHSARILLRYGFIQEQAVLQRMLDEFNEDVLFLSYAVFFNDITELHNQYLSAFWEEEFDEPDDPVSSSQKRPMIRRQKIRAYLARCDEEVKNPSRAIEVARTINKTYSGYVHGASPQIMDLYGGQPPRFHIRGMLGTVKIEEYGNDLWNQFYRGIIAFGFAAQAMGDEKLFDNIVNYAKKFAGDSGKPNFFE